MFVLVIVCFTGVIYNIVVVEIENGGNFGAVFEEDYFHSLSYVQESEEIISKLSVLIEEYKSEEHILKGGTLSEEEMRGIEESLYFDFQATSRSYNPEQSEEVNYARFQEEYADQIAQARDETIKSDLRDFHIILQELEAYDGPLYYGSDSVNVYTNTTLKEKQQFQAHPSYMIFEGYKQELYPKEVTNNEHLYRMTESIQQLNPENHVIYVSYTEEFLDRKVKQWEEKKEIAKKSLYGLLAFLLGFIVFFWYLVLVIGRKKFKAQEVHLHAFDKLYTDLNLVVSILLSALWFSIIEDINQTNIDVLIIPLTLSFGAVGFVLFLSLVKHVKNRTLFKHSLIYTIFYKLFTFIGDVFASGNVGVKTVLLVIGYPLLVAATFFMFPITLGIAAWFALKKVKAFKAIKDGVERIKDGDLHHSISVDGIGEFASLAGNINSIADGLKTAVDSELKSERLKTELITNVSHDIRTPLTSIITYVDLLKKENDLSKIEEYVEVLDQKSKRLKVLTNDLFEAAKASSGSIPVHFEQIDIVSLLTQGLGEVNSKIEALDLDFKLNYPKNKVYITADGKLLWRSLENLLSNIFKYALRGSRVYIDIEDLGKEVCITFKNISAYELNISADELMERFTRGDESRSSQGSGLGLSIAKSLIEIQKGRFDIQVDGDLFKSRIYMPKENS
jgi:signal transduction histidine kinase